MAQYRNHEGYADPTAFAALRNVEREETQQARRRAKEFLSRASRIDYRISSRLEELQTLRSLAEKVTGSFQVFTQSSSSGHGRTEELILKICALEAEMQEDIDELLTLKRRIRSLIAALPKEEHQTLLELRYLSFRPWEEIADQMSYSLHYLYKLHNAALDECDRLLQQDTSWH